MKYNSQNKLLFIYFLRDLICFIVMFLWGFRTEEEYMRNEKGKLRIVKNMKRWWRGKGGGASNFYIFIVTLSQDSLAPFLFCFCPCPISKLKLYNNWIFQNKCMDI